MSSEWPIVRLGDLISLKGGFAYKGEHLGSSGAVLLGMGVVSYSERFLRNGIRRYTGEYPSSYQVSPGDLVIATRQQSDNLPILGCPALVPNNLPSDNVIVGTNLYKVTNNSDIDNRFLYWLLRGKDYQSRIVDCTKGTTVRMITKDAIEDFRFNCPPSSTRKEIVSLLDELDDRINLLQETNKTLEAISQALFKSWFIDFDAVLAKSEGRQPDGMDKATASIFPGIFEDSELGKIPRGWRAGKLSNVATLKGGKMLDKSSFSEAGANPVFGGAGVMGYTDRSNADGFVITVGRVGAYCGQYFWHQGNAWVNNNASLVTPINPSHAQWLYLWLRNVDMELIKKGAAQPFVSNGDISELKIALPPADVIEKFTEYGALIFAKIAQTTMQIKSLINLRDVLLPRLISGQVRLPAAVSEIEALTA